MITQQEVVNGLKGAWGLLLGDSKAMKLFDVSPNGFIKSFFGAILVFPIYILMIVTGVVEFQTSRNLLAVIILDIEFYIIGWVLWPLAISQILPLLDRDELFFRYVVAYNWANVLGAWLFGLIIIISTTLTISGSIATLITGALSIGLLAYHVFVARITLDITLGVAIGLTICEFFLSQIIIIMQKTALT